MIHIHVHDNDGTKDEHIPLGTGSINWSDLMSQLRSFDKRIIIEARNLDEGIKGFEYIRSFMS